MSTRVDTLCRTVHPEPTKFEHESLNQKRTSIRLIQVLPDLSKDMSIQCKLIHAILPPPFTQDDNGEGEPTESSLAELDDDFNEELPSYSCLSYTWGDPFEEYAVRVNDKTFLVRRNLWDFLEMARNQLSDTFLWIDALCIDQTNTSERNHQVQQMGNIFTRAKSVLAWLGSSLELEMVLHSVSMASKERAMRSYREPFDRHEGSSKSRAKDLGVIKDGGLDTPSSVHSGTTVDFIIKDEQKSLFKDSTEKVEKLLEKITEHEYWSRAWVTQEVLLAKHTILVAGRSTHDLFSLAIKFRSAVLYFRENAFENIVDVLLQQRLSQYRETSLKTWGVVNVLHRFRNKKCTIRRDRIYSLLALCKEGKNLTVDYDVPEEHLMRQVLSLRESSMCFCSAAVVSHALSPWEFPSDNTVADKAMFVETHMYACALSSAVCPFCSNWVPFSWTRKKGLVFCLGTSCPDTQCHLFWEQPESIENPNPDQQNLSTVSSSIYAQSRQNNKSQLLCEEGAGIEIKQSEWRHVYVLRFTFRSIVEMLQEDLTTSDLGLNACRNLWPHATSGQVSGQGPLRFCEKA
ncbi:HET-domain-containing protein [Cucurbitaria berberidis CBS 394.84]|uniref:HET-domain-containing protein n=1 Tax=Cucurbitaria berberidis CBS 394.84 TaxID=1168544 RepID=A0A9P4LCX1_9PLEO|nr:HET-domain-containing protein [Cucurbitaria berberidis CBS 394.84]KAF1850460.1 HET-domain-containing protein [Cucurbitaria berberidis CBS 394.84]